MAIVSMTPAVAGNVALAAEYNKLITNITDLDSRTTAVEAAVGGGTGEVPRKGGEWQFGTNTKTLVASTSTLLDQWTAIGTPSGVTYASGVFTVTEAGLYTISTSIRTTAVSTNKYLSINGAAGSDIWSKNSCSGAVYSLSTTATRRLTAGQTIRTYAYADAILTIQREGAGDPVPFISIYKVGN